MGLLQCNFRRAGVKVSNIPFVLMTLHRLLLPGGGWPALVGCANVLLVSDMTHYLADPDMLLRSKAEEFSLEVLWPSGGSALRGHRAMISSRFHDGMPGGQDGWSFFCQYGYNSRYVVPQPLPRLRVGLLLVIAVLPNVISPKWPLGSPYSCCFSW